MYQLSIPNPIKSSRRTRDFGYRENGAPRKERKEGRKKDETRDPILIIGVKGSDEKRKGAAVACKREERREEKKESEVEKKRNCIF